MSLGNVIVFIFASIGMSHIIVDGKIAQSFRDYVQKVLSEFWAGMFTCYQCSGMYTGLFCGYFTIVQPLQVNLILAIILTFICGCAGSFLSAWASIYLNVLEAKMVVNYKENSE
jgi:hypothetical protein